MGLSPAVECLGVSKRFGTTPALRGVDLTVGRARIHGLVGPNGAGKTTLLRMLLGLIAPDDGEVRVLGHDPAGNGGGALDGVAGFVDAPRFYPYLTVDATIRALARLDGDGAVDRTAAALDAVGLAGVTHRKVGKLSTGQRQRLGLAGALIRRPDLLVVDEPTTGLDPAGIRDLHDLVRDLAADGRTVVLSSHDMTEVDRLCDDVTVLAGGRVVFDGPLAGLRATARSATHRLRSSDDARAHRLLADLEGLAVTVSDDGSLTVVGTGNAVDRAVLELAAAGVAVRELVPTETALESEFTRLVGTAS